jgi:serine/threonine-protein kinase
VTDSATGEDLTGSTVMSVFLYNRWMQWSATRTQDFTSGGSYRFRFEKEGYYPQVYSLVVKPYQTVLNIAVQLVPQPGTLAVLSRAPGAEMLLNGSEYYLSGGKDGRFEKLAPLDSGNRQMQLSPGDYRLTVRRPPAQEKSVSFHLGPRGTVSLSIGFDSQQGVLDVETTK